MESKKIVSVPTCLFRGIFDKTQKAEVVNRILDFVIYETFCACNDIEKTYKMLGIVNSGGRDSMMECARRGQSIAEGVDTKSVFYIDIFRLIDMRDSVQSLNEIVLFMMYYALGSIQGKKDYFRTDNLMLLSRMNGGDKKLKSSDELCDELRARSSKYHMAKLRDMLYRYYKVSFYVPTSCKGFYFSTKLELKDLIKRVSFNIKAKESKASLAEDTLRALREIEAEEGLNERQKVSLERMIQQRKTKI